MFIPAVGTLYLKNSIIGVYFLNYLKKSTSMIHKLSL